jgi:hypothetical protein
LSNELTNHFGNHRRHHSDHWLDSVNVVGYAMSMTKLQAKIWLQKRDEAKQAGAKFKIVQEENKQPRYHEFYFRTEIGAQAFLESELKNEGVISVL